ncbi:hypothetical protein [Shimia sp.]|uniref:hypothetical protein n=1 Tax=Shimia sp. TaxID=1954381 RepID=UPI003299D3FA
MNNGLLIAIAAAVIGIGVYTLMPAKEPTVQDKLKEAQESLSEAAEMAKDAVEDKVDNVSSDVEASLKEAKAQAAEYADELTRFAEESAKSSSELKANINKEFSAGGTLHKDGYNSEMAVSSLESLGLNKEAAIRLSSWLETIYATPERADEVVQEIRRSLEK